MHATPDETPADGGVTPEEFRTRVIDACDALLATGSGSVAPLVREVGQWVGEGDDGETKYRILRTLVGAAVEGDDAVRPGVMVALHDGLVRDGVFGAPAPERLLFDEAFYIGVHGDLIEARQNGVIESGWAHFVDCGAMEGRVGCSWQALPGSTVATSVTDAEGRRRGRVTGRTGLGIGVNMIGFHTANLGLGVSARAYRRLLIDAGFDVCPIEIEVPGGRSGHDTSYCGEFLPLAAAAPHRVNLFVMSPAEILQVLAARHRAVRAEGRINAALLFWELARLPEQWVSVLNEMDVVLASSGFIEHAMMMDLDGPVIRRLGHPIDVPPDVQPDRERWGIGAGEVAFVCSFEMASDINRKNPFVGIEAFERALGESEAALLIVKVNNARSSPEFEPHLERLLGYSSRNANIRVVEEVLSYSDVLSLFASCDVLVSLHRAEGLGLCLMEAMTLGKPVVATAWSGNMEFTTEQNSCLVGYDLVPVQNTTQRSYAAGAIRPDARWADARVDEAAQWMRRLVDDPELRRRIGRRAARDMAEYRGRIDVHEFAETLRNVARRRGIDLG